MAVGGFRPGARDSQATPRAEADLSVVSRDDDGVGPTFELVPYSLGKNWRATWDRREPNKLLITTQHESVSRYLGR